MAKRSTIGENPLDAAVSESPLDTVVPDPQAAPKASKPQVLPEDLLEPIQARLTALENAVKALKTEVGELRALKLDMAQFKARVVEVLAARKTPAESWWASLLREKLGGK